MLLVPGGTFSMGADSGGEPDERPAHEVEVAPFWLDETEVTDEAYAECVAAKACPTPGDLVVGAHRLAQRDFRGPKRPVSEVSWSDAVAYCAFRGERLPTEAEWERAARGDDGRKFPWGNEAPTPERAVFDTSHTADVGTHPAGKGPFGHLDLTGNVWEWVQDEYDPYAYRRPTAKQGKPGSCDEIMQTLAELKKKGDFAFTGTSFPSECEHVLRGGAFNYKIDGLRASNRVHHPGRFHLVMAGFRCAKSL
jgi:formylglycine-generating enzyme required for sulfatase activity